MKNDDWTLYIGGDFNLPIIDWESLSLNPGYSSEDQRSASLLLDFKTQHFLTQYVSVDTRKISGQAGSTLDLFLTNDPELFLDISTDETVMSDHKLVSIDLGYNPCLRAPHCCDDSTDPPQIDGSDAPVFSQFNFSKADFAQINEDLTNVNWDALNDANPGDEFVDIFYESVFQACTKSVPLKRTNLHPQSSNGNLDKGTMKILRINARKRTKIRKRLRFLKEFQPSSLTIKNLEENMKHLEINSKNAIMKDREIHERQAIENIKSNPRYFYSYAKKYSKRKCKIGPLKLGNKDNTTLIKHPRRMADVLQNQFKSVFSHPDMIDADQYNVPQPSEDASTPSLEVFDFTPGDIIKAISEINSSSSAGKDGFPATLLKNCSASLAYPIFLIWKRSFETGNIHKKFLTQIITPVHKKGSKSKPQNYRPISLTSHIIKVFERIMRNKLVEYLESNNLLKNFQHGFRHGRSCLSELLAHFDDILKNLNEGNDVDVVYLDFAKAFDKVDHKLLLKKLKLLGISGKVYEWIKSFLSNRYQSVVIDGFHSFILLVISGVPQGTVLGPILFLIYLNDMKSAITSGSILRSFADDSRLFKSISTHHDAVHLQEDLSKVIQWASANNMALHEEKFELLQYSSSLSSARTLLDILPFNQYARVYQTSEDHTLSPADQVQDLGVRMSSQLSFSTHINMIVDKACSKSAWILSVFQNRSKDTMMTLYKSLVRPLLEYCCPLWNPFKVSDIQSIENVQRHFTSKIRGFESLCYWERLKELNLMSLQRRRERYIIIYMWKILNCQVPNDVGVNWIMNSRLGFKASVPSIAVNRKISQAYESSFSIHGAKLWNALPKSINCESHFNSFKALLDPFLLSIPDEPPIQGYPTRNHNSLLHWSNHRFEV